MKDNTEAENDAPLTPGLHEQLWKISVQAADRFFTVRTQEARCRWRLLMHSLTPLLTFERS
jgi:hypothetical protein